MRGWAAIILAPRIRCPARMVNQQLMRFDERATALGHETDALAVDGSAFVAGANDVDAGVPFSRRQVLGKVGIGLNW